MEHEFFHRLGQRRRKRGEVHQPRRLYDWPRDSSPCELLPSSVAEIQQGSLYLGVLVYSKYLRATHQRSDEPQNRIKEDSSLAIVALQELV